MTKHGLRRLITQHAGTERLRSERGMLYGIVLREYPKQVVSLAKAKSVPTNMREYLPWGQKHYHIDVTASTVERKAGGLGSTGTCPGGCKEFSHKGSTRIPSG